MLICKERVLPEFIRVADVREIASGGVKAFSVGRYEVAVFHIADSFHAIENTCPHQGAPLADGWLEGPFVTCPWHAWCFDVRSGRMTLGDFARVPRFEVRIEGTTLFVKTEPEDE